MVMGEQTLETQVAVIGGGPGGYAAAFRAADLGMEVALINQEERLGGVCLRRGCIPTKALLDVAHIIETGIQAREWGILFSELGIQLEKIRNHKEDVVDKLVTGLEGMARAREVQVIQGKAVFESSEIVRIEGKSEFARVKYENAILASGSGPISLPGVEFKQGGRIMSSAQALDLEEIPDTLLVVGAGYIGLEMGTTYAALGSRVTLVEMEEDILPGVPRSLARPLRKRIEETFEALYFNTKVDRIEENGDAVQVTLEGDNNGEELSFDRALIAIGRSPNSAGMDLENTDVVLDDREFVEVDAQQKTADPKIFAVGDVAGGLLLAHKAIHEGKIAAEVIHGEPAAFDARAVPAVIYTDPQIAYCGLMAEDARSQGYEVEVARFPWSASGRATTMGARSGLTMLVIEKGTKRILGMGVVGTGAENLIAEGVLAVEMGAVVEDLALTIHAHPTLSETVGEAAEAYLGLATHILPRKR